MVVGLTERQWRGLVETTGTGPQIAALEAALGRSLADEGARWQARKAITAVLEPWFAARRVADFAEVFDRAGITWSVFRSFAEAVRDDPDLSLDNPMFSEVDQPGIGRYPVPGTPFDFSALAREPAAPAPALGAHTEEILADVAGLPEGEIGRLFDAGVVAGPGAPARKRSAA